LILLGTAVWQTKTEFSDVINGIYKLLLQHLPRHLKTIDTETILDNVQVILASESCKLIDNCPRRFDFGCHIFHTAGTSIEFLCVFC